MKRVVIVGGAGRMGQAMTVGLSALDDVTVVALVDGVAPSVTAGATVLPALATLDPDTVDVVVDFSTPEGVALSSEWCAMHHKGLVVGTTGLGAATEQALRTAGTTTGVRWATNFSLGAVLAERFAAQAAPYFPRVEILELHHDQKKDAPSGTSVTTAHAIASARRATGQPALDDVTERLTHDGARGAAVIDGIRVHSVRLPGLTAHQEVLFGGPGEGLTIRHDSFDRASFVAGVALAVRHVSGSPSYHEGISDLLG